MDKTELYQIVLGRILEAEYPPGYIINEKKLAGEFGVSRSPMREILKRLEWEKLVRTIPRTGTIVTELEFDKIVYVFQIRYEIEQLIGRLAAANITAAQLDRIKAIADECRLLLDTEDGCRVMQTDVRFREVLYEAANNPVLKDFSEVMYNLTIRFFFHPQLKDRWGSRARALLDEIEQTHQALISKDAEKTARLRYRFLKSHLGELKDRI